MKTRGQSGYHTLAFAPGHNQRLRLVVHGAVQGVGFRPFVYRLATEMRLPGWVNNSAAGVFIEVDGDVERLREFHARLEREIPPAAFIQSIEASYLDAGGFTSFEIVESDASGAKTTVIMPDLATCADCLREIFDPTNRRYRYAFTNCTNCGPRYSIVQGLPYDRPNTTMSGFVQCEHCHAEYVDPVNRRFHAQPNACPACGPQLQFCDNVGQILASKDASLWEAADAIAAGAIVAIKGIGGYQLLADARDDDVVRELRKRKHREEKPFALMYPSLDEVRRDCVVSEAEARLLSSSQAPIVLLERQSIPGLAPAESVAPGNPELGVMLPYTPLHHLLMADLSFPVIATSGNLSDEPICIDDADALDRLGGIADFFLMHDRPIARHVDDSVARVMLDRELVMRRARGYAPLPIRPPSPQSWGNRTGDDEVGTVDAGSRPPSPQSWGNRSDDEGAILAVGAHQKCSVAVSVGDQIVVSQHIGDLETAPATGALVRVVHDLPMLYDLTPSTIACDLHPDYESSRLAHRSGLPVTTVQHHWAHVLACMAENDLDGSVLGVAWDGTGLGVDGTIWGGEFLMSTIRGFDRVAHLRPFLLPGGDKAVREPRRTATALLYELVGDDAFTRTGIPALDDFSVAELSVVRTMLQKKLNSPMTSSAGRLFDGVAALIGLRQRTAYEGQAAILLEHEARKARMSGAYSMPIVASVDGPNVIDWGPAVDEIVTDVLKGRANSEIAARFHNGLVEAIVDIAKIAGEERVALTGGCFQSKYLTERAVGRLREEGFRPYWHQRIPPNDGGIAVGQIMAASAARRTKL